MSQDKNPGNPVRTFRQRGAYVTGWVLVGVFVVVLVALAVASGLEVGATAFLLAAAGVVWLILVRPAVRLSADGVRLENLVRDIRMTWPAVDMTEARWNLKVVSPEGDAYSSWAISAQRPKMTGGVTPTPGGQLLPTTGTDVPMGQEHRSGSAGAVASAIDEAKADYERAVAKGAIAEQKPEIHHTVSPVAAAGWAACLLAVVIGFLSL